MQLLLSKTDTNIVSMCVYVCSLLVRVWIRSMWLRMCVGTRMRRSM